MTPTTLERLARECGRARSPLVSHWDEDPRYPATDWKEEVSQDETRQSYREWVESRKAAEIQE